ncbi:MAG: peptidoglycan bridge formation glycyltransferase FemA/FemB family protein [Patescibacteria group bacterium]|nr:peptidoglycan bridge formation glycyltransferase FemA/FemB family protein [Patescibacteria group bacterium]MDD5164175.1 peptidoglycan bridge formation glycyltransferase FemA/FemB family protein [Patescibacteria group bacterium]MDD5534491.1 peptidoglycan bridge formation glycyltransferase FemA/FemB family protein [Patescibacteria group bacterium]
MNIWQGTFKIWQNKDFGKIYARFNNLKLYFLDDFQLFVSFRPLIGNTTLYLYCAPSKEKWINELKSLAKNLGVAKILIYSINPLEDLNNFFKEKLFTSVIDLTGNKELLWEKIGKKTRNMIRKGEKMGVEIKLAETEKEFNQWWGVYSRATQIKGFGRQKLLLVKKLFKDKKISRLFLSIKDNKIIGGTFFLLDEYPMYWLGAFDKKFGDYAPGHINIWETMLSLKEKGFQLLDLGGISFDEKDGSSRFKKSFMGEIKTEYIYEIPINLIKTKFINLVSKIKSKI